MSVETWRILWIIWVIIFLEDLLGDDHPERGRLILKDLAVIALVAGQALAS